MHTITVERKKQSQLYIYVLTTKYSHLAKYGVKLTSKSLKMLHCRSEIYCVSLTPGMHFLFCLRTAANFLFSPSSSCHRSVDWTRCCCQPVCQPNELVIKGKRQCELGNMLKVNHCGDSRISPLCFFSYLVCRQAPATNDCRSSCCSSFLSLSSMLRLSQPAAPPSQHGYSPH